MFVFAWIPFSYASMLEISSIIREASNDAVTHAHPNTYMNTKFAQLAKYVAKMLQLNNYDVNFFNKDT